MSKTTTQQDGQNAYFSAIEQLKQEISKPSGPYGEPPRAIASSGPNDPFGIRDAQRLNQLLSQRPVSSLLPDGKGGLTQNPDESPFGNPSRVGKVNVLKEFVELSKGVVEGSKEFVTDAAQGVVTAFTTSPIQTAKAVGSGIWGLAKGAVGVIASPFDALDVAAEFGSDKLSEFKNASSRDQGKMIPKIGLGISSAFLPATKLKLLDKIPKPGGVVGKVAEKLKPVVNKTKEILRKKEKTAPINKNSRAYQGKSHVYTIKAPDGSVHKVGKSSTGIRVKDSASKRAESQVRKLNEAERAAGRPGGYSSEIRKDGLPSSGDALDYEKRWRDTYRRLFGQDKLPGNREHLRGRRTGGP